MTERIMTLHPEGKEGVNIDKAKYDTMRQAIVDAVGAHDGISFDDLTATVQQQLNGNFSGSINWYVTTVKLDLEARGIIERIPKRSPQQLRLGKMRA